jgi:hypothetical protein
MVVPTGYPRWSTRTRLCRRSARHRILPDSPEAARTRVAPHSPAEQNPAERSIPGRSADPRCTEMADRMGAAGRTETAGVRQADRTGSAGRTARAGRRAAAGSPGVVLEADRAIRIQAAVPGGSALMAAARMVDRMVVVGLAADRRGRRAKARTGRRWRSRARFGSRNADTASVAPWVDGDNGTCREYPIQTYSSSRRLQQRANEA